MMMNICLAIAFIALCQTRVQVQAVQIHRRNDLALGDSVSEDSHIVPAPTPTTSSTMTPAPTASLGAVHGGDTIWLRAHTGKYLTVQGTEVHGKWNNRLSWQAFVIEQESPGNTTIMSGDDVYLRAHTGKRVTVQGTTVHAKWNHMGSWQRLVIEKKGAGGPIFPKDTIYLRAHTGKRVAVEGTMVHAKWDHMLTWQALVLESDDAATRLAHATKTPAPTTTTTAPSVNSTECIAAGSLVGKCEPCLSSAQCGAGRYCCPYMKKCVASSSESCFYPIASCVPPCHSADPSQCACKNADFPEKWQLPTC
jgi:RNase P/RNase MRP subunit p29